MSGVSEYHGAGRSHALDARTFNSGRIEWLWRAPAGSVSRSASMSTAATPTARFGGATAVSGMSASAATSSSYATIARTPGTDEPIPGRRVLIVTYGCRNLTPDKVPVLSHEHKRLGLFTAEEVPALNMPDGYKQSVAAWYQLRDSAVVAEERK